MSTALIPVRAIPHVVIRPRAAPAHDQLTVGSLCDHFIRFKNVKVNAGELGTLSRDRYLKTCERVQRWFGGQTIVDEVTPLDFMEFRNSFSDDWGPHVIGNEVQTTRSIFRYAYESGLVDKPVRFGPSFSKPPKRLYRRERREKGLQMFEAEEIRRMLELARPFIKAMILLGVNCGFGNADCGRLPFSALDLEGGWVNFPRPKTEVDRRCPLWSETVEALKRAIALRPTPNNPADAQCVFITHRGRQRWADGESSTPIGLAIRRLTSRLGFHRIGRNFYGLRRTFETIGGESLDQIAVDYIMGHVPHSNDMAAVYRQRVADDRLIVVTDHVRLWLWPDEASNYFAKFRNIAAAVYADWEQLPQLSPPDVHRALIRTGIKQCELARGIGFHPQWVNTIVRGRKPLSNDAQMRVRTFFQQLSQGKTPAPLPPREIMVFNSPLDVPLTEEVKTALYHHPLKKSDLETLSRCLSDLGITQAKLAEWWGIKRQFYGKMRYGARPIPDSAADRLRELFGLLKICPPRTAPTPVIYAPGKLPMSPAISAIFERKEFGAPEFQEIVCYLRRHLGVSMAKISVWLHYDPSHFGELVRGAYDFRKTRIDMRAGLRRLFADPAEGGATD